jgi:hypothetical protein
MFITILIACSEKGFIFQKNGDELNDTDLEENNVDTDTDVDSDTDTDTDSDTDSDLGNTDLITSFTPTYGLASVVLN